MVLWALSNEGLCSDCGNRDEKAPSKMYWDWEFQCRLGDEMRSQFGICGVR